MHYLSHWFKRIQWINYYSQRWRVYINIQRCAYHLTINWWALGNLSNICANPCCISLWVFPQFTHFHHARTTLCFYKAAACINIIKTQISTRRCYNTHFAFIRFVVYYYKTNVGKGHHVRWQNLECRLNISRASILLYGDRNIL